MPRWLSITPRVVCGVCILVGLAAGCELTPFPVPTSSGEAGAAADGGNDPGGGLMPVGGTDDEGPPCGLASDSGAFVSQTPFAAAGQEQVDATSVGTTGAAWISLGYDQAFEVDGAMLDAPSDRDVVILRASNGTTTASNRIHGTGDQHVRATAHDGTLHVLGWVSDAGGGGAAALSVDGVDYAGFVDGDAFYLHIGATVDVYRLTGDNITPKAIAFDLYGQPWIVGDFQGTLTLSGSLQAGGLEGNIQTVTGTSPTMNSFVARLVVGGERLTAIGPPAGEGTVDDETRVVGGVPFGEDGEVIVFGDFRGRVQLRTSLYEAEAESDLWIARIETDGSVSDRAHYSSSGTATASSILITPGGRGVIVGTHTGDLGFVDPPNGDSGMFVSQVKLRDLKRGRTRGFSAPTGELHPTSLARYPWGNGIIIAGQFTGESYPLGGDIATNGDATPDGFILALEGDLDDLFAWHLAATGTASLQSVASAPCHPAAVVGSFDTGSVVARRLSSSDDVVNFVDAAQLDAFLLRLSY